MVMWGVAVESEFGSQQHWDCSDNTRKRKREKSVSASASAASLVFSPYFQEQPQLNHGIGINTKPQKRNKRKRRSQGCPTSKLEVEAKRMVTIEEKVASPYFQKTHEGEGAIPIISSNKKGKTKGKAQALNDKRVVSPNLSHEKNDIVVANNSNTKVSRHFQPQQEQSLSPLKKQGENNASMNNKRSVSPYVPHGVNDIAVALNDKRVDSPYFPHERNDIEVANKSNSKVSRHFQPQQEQSPSPLKKQGGDNDSLNKNRLVSPYFPHGVNDIVVASKATPTVMKVKNDAYKRKSQDNAWVPPMSVHDLLQEKYYDDPWKVLVICMLLNKTSGNQAKNVIQDLFELCPNAEAATMVEIKEIEEVIRSLGLQKKRSQKIQKLSEHYLRDDWTHVDDLPGIGKYAADAYAIFCTGCWKDVVPDDHKLIPYWKDLWTSEKTGNCCKDKSMDSESP